MEGFKIIGMRLREMYQMITLGGDAELELLDSLDPFSEGIVFSVRRGVGELFGERRLRKMILGFGVVREVAEFSGRSRRG